MSEQRRTKRLLLRRGSTKDKIQVYADNKGNEYDYKIAARLSSFFNITMGCFKNGFPVVVKHLFYPAWAFYPFFFMRANLKVKDPTSVILHERTHIRQQRDIHITFSLPLLLLCGLSEVFGWFSVFPLLGLIPFIPTIIYGFEMVRSFRNLLISREQSENGDPLPVTFQTVRENTCFEREANMHSLNSYYLYERKFWAVLAYTGWKRFSKYGMK